MFAVFLECSGSDFLPRMTELSALSSLAFGLCDIPSRWSAVVAVETRMPWRDPEVTRLPRYGCQSARGAPRSWRRQQT